ncbi:beta-ketoacyl-ACP synthase III, partial [Mucilaginibacter sp. 5B2]|nr:beta-ketoacyl-ACP synthase III [Mucilaginibacter sp. 5B2]
MIHAKITAVSSYVPEQVITNKWFEDKIETQDEWIASRTGISERRFAAKDQFTSDLCIRSVDNLLRENPAVAIKAVDFIIVATTTADQVMPSMASRVQDHFQIPGTGCIDLMAACAGFVYGIILAKGMIASGTHKKILVIGAETLSKFTDFTDRTSCILFGDAAGVALIEPSVKAGIGSCVTGTDGSHGKDLYLSQQNQLIDGEEVAANGKIHQNGRVVYKWAVQNMSQKILELLAVNNLKLADLDWIILHSANLRIIEAVALSINYPMEQMLTSIERFGNTSSASIPLAWDLAAKADKIKKGDKALLLGFGGGLTYAG